MSWRSMVLLGPYTTCVDSERCAAKASRTGYLASSLASTNAAPRGSIYRRGRRDKRAKLFLVRRAAPVDRFDRPGVVATHRRGRLRRSRSAFDERELARLGVLAAPLLGLGRAHDLPRHRAVDGNRAAVVDGQVDGDVVLVLLIEARAVGQRARGLHAHFSILWLSGRNYRRQCQRTDDGATHEAPPGRRHCRSTRAAASRSQTETTSSARGFSFLRA